MLFLPWLLGRVPVRDLAPHLAHRDAHPHLLHRFLRALHRLVLLIKLRVRPAPGPGTAGRADGG